MSELPKTRKWNVRRKSAFMDQVQTDLDLADAMRDELLAHIGELEAEVKRQHDLHDRAEIARKALYQRAEQAETALADRDKTIGVLRFTIDDLRARAEAEKTGLEKHNEWVAERRGGVEEEK